MPLPEVTSVRKKIGAAPNRTFPDGTPFYTLPIISDASTSEIVGDSFDIALYLDKRYPSEPRLFRDGAIGLTASFNVKVDKIFTDGVLLFCHGLPFDPDLVDQVKAIFVERSKVKDWDELTVRGEERKAMLEKLKSDLLELSKIYRRRHDGPFLEGGEASYADLIVGAWLATLRIALPRLEWEDLSSWDEGLWGKLDQALQEKYAEIR